MSVLDQLQGLQVTIRTFGDDVEGELVDIGGDGVVVKETRLNDSAARWETRVVFVDQLSIRVVEGPWT